MNHSSFVLAFVTTASGLAAQSISVSVTALLPISASCTSGVQSASQVLPAGPLGMGYNATAQLGPGSSPSVHAMADGFVVAHVGRIQVTATNFLYDVGFGLAQTASATQDLLVQLTATGPTRVRLEVSPTVLLSAGVLAPLLEVDVGNDGLVEWTGLFGAAPLGTTVLGPQPLPIRMRLSSQVAASSFALFQSTAAITLLVEPDNQVDIVQTVVGCAGLPSGLERPVPVFDGGGVDLVGAPSLMVIGFGTQPTLFTPQSPLPFVGACLLMPTVDVLSWEPDGHLRLPLPPAVRPATLHVQAVLVGPLFALTDGYRIYAF